jgi:tetratricopeptide (TPR) repeat protein
MKSLTITLLTIAISVVASAAQAATFQVGDLAFPKSYPMNLKVGTQATTAVTSVDYLTVLKINGEWLWVESRNIFTVEVSAKGWIKANALDDLDTQILWANSLIDRERNEPYWYNYAGLICRLSDDPAYLKQAISYFSREIAVAPANDEIFKMRAYCWSRLEKYDLAIADMETAVSLDPSNESYVSILGLYRDSQQYANGTVIPAPVAPVAVTPPPTQVEGLEPSA